MYQNFYNSTEMEASARVLIIVLEILDMFPTVKLRLQPKRVGHPSFTAFLLVKDDEKPLLIIEVKNVSLTALVLEETETTAQVLRELHILLVEEKGSDKIPFILSNSVVWSFGTATKRGFLIEISDSTHITISPQDMNTVVHKIKDMLPKELLKKNI